MNIERRLNKLEAERCDGGVVAVTVPVGMSKDEAIRRHFGKQGEPENALVVLIQQFSEAAP
jgi:hypothetical protein